MSQKATLEQTIAPQMQNLQKKIFDLAVRCPSGHRRSGTCLLRPLQIMGMKERSELIRKLSHEDLLEIQAYCERCLIDRTL